jgi:hypothetical protein
MLRIDQGDADDGRRDAADTPPPSAGRPPEAPDPRNPTDAAARVVLAAEDRTEVDAVYRAYAIDQGYARVRDLERGTVTPAMKQIEAEDPDRHPGKAQTIKGSTAGGGLRKASRCLKFSFTLKPATTLSRRHTPHTRSCAIRPRRKPSRIDLSTINAK